MNYAGEVEWKTQEFQKKTNKKAINRKAIKRTACEKKKISVQRKKQKEVDKNGARKVLRRKRLNDKEEKQRKSERE